MINYRAQTIIYVDNCCNVRAKLQTIFGSHVLICLDIFHWLKRWDDIVADKKSERYPVFRSLLSRCVLQASVAEYREKSELLEDKLGRQPTAKEILKQCNKSTPAAADIDKSVRAVVEFFLLEDARIIAATPTTTTTNGGAASSPPQLFLKDPTRVRDVLRKQLSHVNCLCDPPNVNLYRRNAAGKTNCSRSSSQNERFNLGANREILRYSSVSVTRGNRTMYSFVDGFNKSANIRRRGATDYHTSNMESLAYANSLAEALGIESLPFPDVSLASMSCMPCQEEKLGFELDADGFDKTSDSNMGLDSDDVVEEDMEETRDANDDNDMSESDAAEVERIEELLGRMRDTEIQSAPRNSLEAFSCLTGENPWLPFLEDNSPRAKAEQKLFDDMKENFNRNASPATPVHGYEAFSKAWSQEVGQRYLARLAGVVDDEDTESDIIYSKTAKQLSDYYDKRQCETQTALLSTIESSQRQQNVNRIIRSSRASVSTPNVVQVQPIQYPMNQTRTPLGAPLALNTMIAFPRGSVAMNPTCTGGAAPFVPPTPQFNQQIPTCLPSGTYRRICRHCGRVRSQHRSSKEFGMGKCKFIHCARCLQPHTKMGLMCEARPGPNVLLDDLVMFDMSVKSLLG